MQTTDTVELIELEPRHIPEAHRLSSQEKWPHRPEDWAAILEVSRGFGCMSDGQLVGTCIFTPYGETSGTVNMVIVDPSTRGTGLGRRLMQTALDAAEGREARLVATEAGRPLYEKMGFVATGTVTQRQGIAKPVEAPEGDVQANADDLDALIALDLQGTGMQRDGLMALLLREGRVLVLRDDSGIRAYVALRQFGRGTQIGPLVAGDDADARLLLQSALASCAGDFTRFDLTAAAAPLADLVEACGLEFINTGVAMVRPGPAAAPKTGPARAYALASQALG